jgi:hypothetical protein
MYCIVLCYAVLCKMLFSLYCHGMLCVVFGQARVFALTKLWIKLEKKVRDSLLPKVKQAQMNQTQKQQLENMKCAAWEV